MKQKTGAAAAILLTITAIIGYSALPLRNSSPATPGSEAAQGTTGKNVEPPLHGMESLKAPCREIEERIAEFLPDHPAAENGGASAPKILAPEKCFEQNAAVATITNGQDGGTTTAQDGGTTAGTPAEMTNEEKRPTELRFMIATLPNPVHTHLPLEFDRMTEALQQAAQDQGYNYDSSWLPWIDNPRQYGSYTDEEKEEARRAFQQKQPGLLVFRKSLPRCPLQDGGRQDNQTFKQAATCADKPYPDGLLVFVVGENATGGIDGDQFQNAISWIETLRPRGTGHNLRVLGPFFSGSFPSLAQLLTTGAAKEYIATNMASISDSMTGNFSAVEVFSGNASSDLGIHWFSSFMKGNKLGHFTTFQESDDLVINRYCRLLTRQGYDTGRLAIISEDETAYGAIGANAQVASLSSTDNPDPSLYECIQHERDENRSPLNLYYPRDIAAVRSAYEKQSLVVSQSGGHIGLTESLAESDSGEHDTIRTYGGEQTTLSQEAALFSLVNLLKAHRIEFIVLRSSNSLDQLFLTQFFARTYSDARVVILNSDVMFRRSSDTPGFRGTMTLSTYPLPTWQQDWTYYQSPENRHSHRTFSDANAEGIYLASRFLIHLQDSELGLDSDCDALDLAAPYSNCTFQVGTPISFVLPENHDLTSWSIENPAANAPKDDLAHRFSIYLRESDLYHEIPRYSVLLQDHGLASWLIENPAASTYPPTWLSISIEKEVWPIVILQESTSSEKPSPRSSVLLQDYGLPSWLIKNAATPTRPPTWLSVVGGGQVWPVAIIDETTLPESLPLPKVEYGSSKDGTTPFGEYYVKARYLDDHGRTSELSPETSIWICPAWPGRLHLECNTLLVKGPAIPPTWAARYRIYIGGTPGSETFQAEKPIGDDYIQSGPLQENREERISATPTAPDRSLLDPVYTNAPRQVRDLLILPWSIRICFSLVFMWCLWHTYCCWAGSQTATPRCRAYFAPVRGPQHNVLIFFGCFLVALTAVTMATFTGTLSGEISPFIHDWRMTVLYCALIVLSCAALIANYWKVPAGRRSGMRNSEKKAEEDYLAARRAEEQALAAEEKTTEDNRKAISADGAKQIPKRIRVKRILKDFWRRNFRSRFHPPYDKARNWVRQYPQQWSLLAGLLFMIAICVPACIFYLEITSPLGDWNRVFTNWRSVNLFTGVSPLTPFLLLIAGMYGWFWYTVSGLALFNRDRPKLPSSEDLDLRLVMFSRERRGRKIEQLAKPLSGGYGIILPGLFLGLIGTFFFFTQSDDFSIRSLGSKSYGRLFFVWLCMCVALIIADAFQMLRIWSRLRELLIFLNHLPARRTLHAMKGFSWGTVWKMGGGVLEQRYKLFWRQMESFRHLRNELQRLAAPDLTAQDKDAGPFHNRMERPPDLKESFSKRLDTCETSGQLFVAWYINSYHDSRVTDLTPVHRHQEEVAKTAAAVCNSILLRKWHEENHSLIQELTEPAKEGSIANNPELSTADVPEFQRLAEEFFLLPYLGFIQNILGRMRTLAIGMLWLFIAAAISVASYPFDPRPVLGGMFLFVFLLVGMIIVFVYAGMHRDTTLSYITNTNPGELGMDFWVKLISLGAAPLLALLTAYFPEMAGFLTSWVQPRVGSIK